MRSAKANSSSSLHEQSITTSELRKDFHDPDNESFMLSYRKTCMKHVHPTTVFASRRLTYRRPCHASIRQDKRASTERANANWKREVKVLRSRLVYGDLHRLRVLIRSFVQPSTRDVDVDIVESRSNVRRTTKLCRGYGWKTRTLCIQEIARNTILTVVQSDIARVILRKEGWRSPKCPTTEGMHKGLLSPFSSLRGAHVIFAPLFVSGIVYCQPRFVSHEAIPRIPSGPSSSVRPIWPALGELSTGAGNRGVLGAWLICISMPLLLIRVIQVILQLYEKVRESSLIRKHYDEK
ncbi:hypothetical protein EAG_09355 [Camponotus floridanus]|uniref:Uncharacterized protein n=1 Tax=Camponotus floridanus TaxID=104421 RepID=E2B0P4_CAMFO|nr:hypothetical protein EAG_09355 [Camponotus floridanus]